jgi:outer membrane protein assembly factor BamE (lipoprotein component of BamABCDE complex)
MKRPMKSKTRLLGLFCATLALLSLGGCDRDLLSGSKLTSANYDQITLGMSKTQVETILGAPATIDSKNQKTIFRYENGKKFAIITFKNDEVDSKDTNLGREP